MQQMRGRVVEDGLAATLHVDAACQHIAQYQRTFGDAPDMAMELAGKLLGVGDLDGDIATAQLAAIADLATGLGIERRTVGEHDNLVAGFRAFDRTTLLEQRHDLERIGVIGLVAQKHRRRHGGDQIGRQCDAATELAGGTRGLALTLHGELETLHVHPQATLACDVGGQIDREPVGIEKTERIGAGNHFLRARGDVVEDLHAGVQRLGKTLFFGQQCARDGLPCDHQFGIGLAHQLDQGRHHLAEERLAYPQHPAVAQRTPDDPAQHIAAAFIGRQHTVDDQERTGADVIGDHPQRLVLQIGDAGQRAGLADQGLE